jgi:hypothetical protein
MNRSNLLRMALYGSNTNIFYTSDKVNVFVRKFDLFISQGSKNYFLTFKTLNKFWGDNEIQLNSNIFTDTLEHL